MAFTKSVIFIISCGKFLRVSGTTITTPRLFRIFIVIVNRLNYIQPPINFWTCFYFYFFFINYMYLLRFIRQEGLFRLFIYVFLPMMFTKKKALWYYFRIFVYALFMIWFKTFNAFNKGIRAIIALLAEMPWTPHFAFINHKLTFLLFYRFFQTVFMIMTEAITTLKKCEIISRFILPSLANKAADSSSCTKITGTIYI